MILIRLARAAGRRRVEGRRGRRKRKTAKRAKKRGDGVIYKPAGTTQSEATPDDVAFLSVFLYLTDPLSSVHAFPRPFSAHGPPRFHASADALGTDAHILHLRI